MTDLMETLVVKNVIMKRKIILLQEEYVKKHQNIDEKKMRKYVNCRLKQEVEELLNLNIKPVVTLFKY